MGFLFYRKKTLIRKSIMIRACRKARAIGRKRAEKRSVTWYDAEQMLSRLDWFKYTNSYGCYVEHINPFINAKALKRKISAHDRRENNENRVSSSQRITGDPSGGDRYDLESVYGIPPQGY